MNFEPGSPKTIVIILLAVAILAILFIIAREIHRALHPRSKPARKRKRRDF